MAIIGIHQVHREMARVVEMNTDRKGNLTLGTPEIMLVMKLLRQNFDMIQQLDGLKNLAYHAYEMGDMEWHMDIVQKIDDLEAAMI